MSIIDSQYPSTLALLHIEDWLPAFRPNMVVHGESWRTSAKRKMQYGHSTPSWRWNRWSGYWCCWGRETQCRSKTFDTIKTRWSWHLFCWLLQWEPTWVLHILNHFEMLNNGSHGGSFWWLLLEASLCNVSYCSCCLGRIPTFKLRIHNQRQSKIIGQERPAPLHQIPLFLGVMTIHILSASK